MFDVWQKFVHVRKFLSTYEGQMFCPSYVDKFFRTWTKIFVRGQIFVRRHTFVFMKLLRRTKISPYKMRQNTCNFFKIWLSQKCPKSIERGPKKQLYTPRKSQTNEKNILFQFLCLPLSLKKCVHIWFEMSSVTSVEKRESRKHFSASASKMRPRLQKTFPWFPFFYFGNFGQISNQTWTNFSSDVVSTKIKTKYYCFRTLPVHTKKGHVLLVS